MMSVNNTVVVDHNGRFIYIDPGYTGSYHDVNILRNSALYLQWRDHFIHNDDDFFEYLIGDTGCEGADTFSCAVWMEERQILMIFLL